MDASERQEPETARPRPRVIDKRVSARDPSEAPETPKPREPAPEAPPVQPPEPSPEPSPEEAAMVKEIAATPSRDWIVNVALTLVNVADVKLSTGSLDDARMAIEALAGMLDRVGDDLGDASAPLRQALAQLQLAYATKAKA